MKQATPKSIKKRTMTKKAAFLRAIGDNCSITRSARLADIDRTTHYEWLAQDEKYKAISIESHRRVGHPVSVAVT
jgi:response regulator of citrate/malate metabolism